MDKFREKVLSLKDKVVSEVFPELSDLEIWMDTEKGTDELMGYGELTWSGYYVDVDAKMRNASDNALYGGLAHELAHIFIDKRKNFVWRWITDYVYGKGVKYQKKEEGLSWWKKAKNRTVYRWCHKYVVWDERNTDLLVVERGAGKQLLAFLKFHNKHYKKYKPDEGLTVKELKDILVQRSEKRYT